MKHVQQVVEAGGGVYVGSRRLRIDKPYRVVFNDPETGTTITIKEDELTVDSVRLKIQEAREVFKEEA